MDIKDSIYIGKIAKLHGYKGGVSLYMDLAELKGNDKLEYVYIDLDGILTPFYVESMKQKNKGFVAVKFEGVDSEEDAQNILKKKVYAHKDLVAKQRPHGFLSEEVIGFEVCDKKKGGIGKVSALVEHKSNPLIVISFKDKEILIPQNEEMVLSVDLKEKRLIVDAPDGLIDIYLDQT